MRTYNFARHKPTSRAYLLFVLFAVIYIALTFWLPANPTTLTRYNLTPERARGLSLAVILPYIIIWFIAFFGYARLKRYVNLIERSPDGQALSRIANGLLILAVGLPVAAILGKLLSYTGNTHPHLIHITTITSVYIDLLIGLLGMAAVYRGAQRLALTVNQKVKTSPSYVAMISLALIGTSYAYLTFTNPARQFPTEELGRAAYYLPDFLLLVTVVIPFVAMWYMGLHAAAYIQAYRRGVPGVLYRSALGYLASGIVFIILSRVTARYLTSLNTVVSTWTLNYLLIAVYCLLALIAIGFILVAKGANKLKKIEEV